MAITVTESVTDPIDSFSKGNEVQQWHLTGTSSADKTVKALVADTEIWFKGHLYCSGATVITFKSATGGTPICVLGYIAAGTQMIPTSRTEAGELLEITSSATVTVGGTITTLEVASGKPLPKEWSLA